MVKKCKFCSKELKQREDELEVHYLARIFCNRSCAAKQRWVEKKENGNN